MFSLKVRFKIINCLNKSAKILVHPSVFFLNTGFSIYQTWGEVRNCGSRVLRKASQTFHTVADSEHPFLLSLMELKPVDNKQNEAY